MAADNSYTYFCTPHRATDGLAVCHYRTVSFYISSTPIHATDRPVNDDDDDGD